jgi:hypothetical protein
VILRKLSEDATSETIGWDPVPNSVGYKFVVSGKTSHTWDGNRDRIRIAKGASLQVEALGVLDRGGWPTPGGIVVAPPVGPFTVRDGLGTVDKFPDCWTHTTSVFNVTKKHVKAVKFAGLGSQQTWPPNVTNPARTTITDCIAENIGTGGSQGGTGEAGAWLGNPTTMQRVHIKDCDWMGVNLVARSQGSLLEDVTVENCPVGVYFELATHDVTLRRVATRNIAARVVSGGAEPLGILAARSHTMEWWHRFPEYGGVTGPYNITFDQCDIYCPPRDPRFESGPTGFDPSCGVYIGPGCYGIKFVNGCRFWGPGWAVLAPNVRANNGPDVTFSSDTRFEQAGPNLSKHSLPMGT